MAANFSMITSQVMRMEQRLTPQLIQSMEILQLPILALEARIREELQTNPVLEEGSEPAADASIADAPDAAEGAAPTDAENRASHEAEAFERLDRLSREYDFDPGDIPFGRGSAGGNSDRDAKLEAMANSAARGPSLQEHLERQWALLDLAPEVKHAGLIVISWMDADGYLRTRAEHETRANDEERAAGHPLVIRRDAESLEALDAEIAHSVSPPIDPGVLEEAIARVQSLEPRGVGARDLTECLLIQLDALPEPNPLAEQLVENHLQDIARNRFPAIARDTGQPIERIKEALAVIARLHHHPGLLISSQPVPLVLPDILVEYAEDGAGYTVRLARGSAPRLRISAQYRDMLVNRAGDAETREFIRRNLEAAKSLIDAIAFRRDRLLEIARIVVARQRDFFDLGPQHLHILRMRDVAAELNCDPSTISRTVDQKYVQSPRGIHPLRMFFTGGTEAGDGTAITWDAIKARVREIIDGEDKSNPLSDDEIARKLAEGGSHLRLSRRTIAKYRAQLNIPQARERRQF